MNMATQSVNRIPNISEMKRISNFMITQIDTIREINNECIIELMEWFKELSPWQMAHLRVVVA